MTSIGITSVYDHGLIDMWNRWQDPETGRFLGEDPARDGNNWYAYVGNNPLTFTDPTGLISHGSNYNGYDSAGFDSSAPFLNSLASLRNSVTFGFRTGLAISAHAGVVEGKLDLASTGTKTNGSGTITQATVENGFELKAKLGGDGFGGEVTFDSGTVIDKSAPNNGTANVADLFSSVAGRTYESKKGLDSSLSFGSWSLGSDLGSELTFGGGVGFDLTVTIDVDQFTKAAGDLASIGLSEASKPTSTDSESSSGEFDWFGWFK